MVVEVQEGLLDLYDEQNVVICKQYGRCTFLQIKTSISTTLLTAYFMIMPNLNSEKFSIMFVLLIELHLREFFFQFVQLQRGSSGKLFKSLELSVVCLQTWPSCMKPTNTITLNGMI